MQLPLGRLGARAIIEALRVSGHDLGRDSEELKRVFDAFPDTGLAWLSLARCDRSWTGGGRW